MASLDGGDISILTMFTCCGLWSYERGTAFPSLSHNTPRESPTLATVNLFFCSKATNAVVPEEKIKSVKAKWSV